MYELRRRGRVDHGLLKTATRLVIDRGLIGAAAIHRFGIRTRDLSQSNGVALVECGNGEGYAVKDMRRRPEADQGSPARELALYRAVAGNADLQRFLPKLHDYDADREVMILEGLTTARRLDQSDHGNRALDPDAAGRLGTALGCWHRTAALLTDAVAPAEPWMLRIDGDRRLAVLDTDERLRSLIRRMLGDEILASVPGRVRGAWRRDTVIHGDVRFANILFRVSPPGLTFIDWETSGHGDAAWDIGAAIQEYLSVGTSNGDVHVAAPAVAAFLNAYRDAARVAITRVRLAPFVACRLMMRAVQLVNWSGDPKDGLEQHLALARAVAAGRDVLADGEETPES